LYSTRMPSPSLLQFQEQLSDRSLASKWLIPYRNPHSHFGESLVLLLMKTMINDTFILIPFSAYMNDKPVSSARILLPGSCNLYEMSSLVKYTRRRKMWI
jgi:hypothetical protein